jgi:thymidylate synthase (FAD)
MTDQKKEATQARPWIGMSIKCLDDGFIRLIDYMASDAAVVQAARVSYGEGTKSINDDTGLIRYLMRHRHTTPFEMCEFKFHIRVPMDTWRQWIRHRTASVNEYSTRYSIAIDAAQKTDPKKWRIQSKDNKQGSSGYLDEHLGVELSEREKELQKLARDIYEERIGRGVAKEQARKDLPLSTYTEAYWKIDLHNLLHFLSLRIDSHAQYEIRMYAQAIAEIIKKIVPITYTAFEDYVLQSIKLSGPELQFLKEYAATPYYNGNHEQIKELVFKFFKNKGEANEFIEKTNNHPYLLT